MPVFAYTARDRQGQLQRGSLEAESDSGAAAALREQGLWVTHLRAADSGGRVRGRSPLPPGAESSAWKRMRSPVSLRDLSIFYRQLFTLLNAGMPIYQSLESLSHPAQSPNSELRRVVVSLGRHVLGGGRLSAAMERFPWLFDRMQVRLVEAGESGGMLVEILQRLADYTEREYEIRMEVKRRTLYPRILLAALIVIPAVPALVLGGWGPFLREIWGTVQWLVLGVAPVVLALRYLVTTRAGREYYDQLKLALPVFGKLVRKLTVARFARTLAALYSAGVPIMSSVELAGEASGNAMLERRAHGMALLLEQGAPLSQVMASSGFFTPMVLGMVATGENTGNLDGMLNRAAEYYEEEARHAVIQLTVVLGVLLLLGMALLIAIKVIGFWGGFYGGGAGGGGFGELLRDASGGGEGP
jgi:type IV pilus assembly protein PilC